MESRDRFSVAPDTNLVLVRSLGDGKLHVASVRLPHRYRALVRVVANDDQGVLLQDKPEKSGQPRQWYVPWEADLTATVTAQTWKSYRFDRVLRTSEGILYVALNGRHRTALRYRGNGEFSIVPEPEAASLLQSLPLHRHTDGPPPETAEYWHAAREVPPVKINAANGAACWAQSSDPFEEAPGSLFRKAGGTQERFTLSRKSLAEYRRLRPEEYRLRSGAVEASQLIAAIGPLQIEARRIWFGRAFYNGEGLTGIGGFGYLDCGTGEFREIHPPQALAYSAIAMLVEPDAVWLSLGAFEEYGPTSGGLLRWNRADESTRYFAGAPMANELIRDQGHLVLPFATGIAVLREGSFTSFTLCETPGGRLRLQPLRSTR